MSYTSQSWFDMSNSRDCTFEENIFLGAGLRARNATGLRIDNNTFLEVDQALDLRDGTASLSGNAVSNLVPIDPTFPTSRWHGGSGSRSYGYVPSSGPAVPAQCPHCKAIFPSRNYRFTSYKLYLNRKPNTETCPNCGFGEAVIADGVFDLSREMIRVLSGPDSTYALIEVIAGIARAVTSGQLSPERATEKAAEIHPEIGGLVRRLFGLSIAAGAFGCMILGALADYTTIRTYADENPDFMDSLLSRVPGLITQELPQQPRVPEYANGPSARPSSQEPAGEFPSTELKADMQHDCGTKVPCHVSPPPSHPNLPEESTLESMPLPKNEIQSALPLEDSRAGRSGLLEAEGAR